MGTKATGRAVLANLRIWWPELILAAIVALVWATQNPQNAIAVLVAVGIGWAMGFRHRHRPIFDVIRGMDAKLDEALGEDDRPVAEVRRLRSV